MVWTFSVPNLQTAQWSINGNKMKGHRGEARKYLSNFRSLRRNSTSPQRNSRIKIDNGAAG